MRFYVHGAGRAGREAWPRQSAGDAVFADHSVADQMSEKARLIADQCPTGGVVLVAHSLGAVPAVLAHTAGTVAASHLVLLEPALYDVARGEEVVERHVEAITEARERAKAGDLFAAWQAAAPIMRGREATRSAWEDDREFARRVAESDVPWGHGIEASAVAAIRTLVLTGRWNDEYELIAQRLGTAGAVHVHLDGTGHRPQDHPDFEAVLTDFLGTHR